MPFNGSGTFVRLYNWVTDRSNGIKIRADRMDEEMDGFAAGLSNSIARDGQSTISNNIPFNSKKITGLGDAAGPTDALNRQSGDARYLLWPNALTGDGAIVDADILGYYKVSATANRGITYAQLKTKLNSDGIAFATATAVLFQQTAAPTGWTKATTHNDKALRLTSGVVGSGGTLAWGSTFGSRALSGTVGATTLAIGNIPAHHHTINNANGTVGAASGGVAAADSYPGNTGDTGGGTSHTHSLSMTALDLDIQYVDVIIATKN